MKTRTIKGIKINLEEGRNYVASRPIDDGRESFGGKFEIIIRDQSPDSDGQILHEVHGYTLDEANEFLKAFNNKGPTSFDGRDW